MTFLLLLINAQLDGKMERNLDGCTKQYNNESCLCVVYVL